MQRYAKRIGRTIAGVSRESMERLMRVSVARQRPRTRERHRTRAGAFAGGVLEIGRGFPAQDRGARRSGHRFGRCRRADDAVGRRGDPCRARHLDRSLEDVQRAHIAATLNMTGWVIEGPRGAARILDCIPIRLRSRMKKLGLTRGQDCPRVAQRLSPCRRCRRSTSDSFST